MPQRNPRLSCSYCPTPQVKPGVWRSFQKCYLDIFGSMCFVDQPKATTPRRAIVLICFGMTPSRSNSSLFPFGDEIKFQRSESAYTNERATCVSLFLTLVLKGF